MDFVRVMFLVIVFGVERKVCNMQQQDLTDTFVFDQNMNSNVRGQGNTGQIIGNHNAVMYCENSAVEILNNRNMHLDIIGSTFTAIDLSNSNVVVRRSNVIMKSNSNININVQGAKCTFEGNHNLHFEGEGGSDVSQFVGNHNGNFRGKDNNIAAFDNHNLMVCGNNNQLEIANSFNHEVQPATTHPMRNVFAVKSNGWQSIGFVVQYVGAAVIKGPEYLLGIVQFRIAEDIDKIIVTLQEAEDVTHSVVDTAASKIVIKAEKNGVVQTLELIGLKVDSVNSNSINIFF